MGRLMLVELARDARTVALRHLPSSAFTDARTNAEAARLAAAHGRVAVLELLRERGVTWRREVLVEAAIRGDAPATLAWLENGEPETVPEWHVLAAVESDAAGVMRLWISAARVADPVWVAHQAAKVNAICCLRALLALEPVREALPRIVHDSHSSLVHERFPVRASQSQDGSDTAGQSRPRKYTYLTPSEEIDVNATTLRFLLYRRLMRLIWLPRAK
ncbi:hypothetical protein [Sediminicoccus sp. KRV36]|uniref:hypothetical protein n=1 Tax=Sediminicoccus sp. KRV36 TaxID=3133721 RepID=UPI00201063EF|nr:hypothetical protein [Sediminicoccus rosea]UPY37439.1 hypothetical protein LHU95_01750 [Sediminicoccus rosea]